MSNKGTIMMLNSVGFIFLLYYSIFSQIQDPTMYLCLDSMIAAKRQSTGNNQKLVYGYINGTKTPCMTEYDLRITLSNGELDKNVAPNNKTPKPNRAYKTVYHEKMNGAKEDLRGFDLQGIDFSSANLQNALLESADLRGAKFNNANLKGANLKNSYCKNADFSNADFSDAQISGAFFINANLKGAQGLTIENLCTVSTLFETVLDQPLYEVLKTRYPKKFIKPTGGWKQDIFPEMKDIPTSEQADPKQFH